MDAFICAIARNIHCLTMSLEHPSCKRTMGRRRPSLILNLSVSLVCLAMLVIAATIYNQPIPRYALYTLPGALLLGAIYFVNRFRRQTTQSYKQAFETI